jgi:Cytosol aminopeptidase family, N-terminal domain
VSGFHSESLFGDDDSIDKNSANTSKAAAIAPTNIVRPHLLHFWIAIAGPRLQNTTMRLTLWLVLLACPGPIAYAQTQPAPIDIPNSPIPVQILAQSPAEAKTDLQVICLFRSSPVNTLHGSLVEANEKLRGLLDRIRNPNLFRGELAETLLLVPPKGSLGARKLLVIGLGDSQTFSPERMQLVGEVVYSEASRLGVAHPFFAPTILDGGVNKFTTGQVSEQVFSGFLRAATIDKVLKDANGSASPSVAALTFLAGAKNVDGTRVGIEKAISAASLK